MGTQKRRASVVTGRGGKDDPSEKVHLTTVEKMPAPILARVERAHHWKITDNGPVHVEGALTDKRIAAHLSGGIARGACPIKRGESTTRFALLDLDDHDNEATWDEMRDATNAIARELKARGLCPSPWRSRNGAGVHLYLLWDAAQDAHSVRELLKQALTAAGFKSGAAGVKAGEIEIFPKQSSVALNTNKPGQNPSRGSCGNMFVLPGSGKSEPLAKIGWPMSAAVPHVAPAARDRTRAAVAAVGPVDMKSLRREVFKQDPDVGYDDWLRTLQVIHAKTKGSDEGLALAIEWSGTALVREVASAELIETKWRSFGNHPNPATSFPYVYRASNEDVFDDCTEEAAADEKAEEGAVKRERRGRVPAHEFAAGDPPPWLVKGVLPQVELAVIYGAPASGKTFTALDLVCAIARGAAWRGRKVRQGSVVYVCAEGAGGFKLRLRAYAHQAGIALEDLPLDVIADQTNLLDKRSAKSLHDDIVAGSPPAVVVIDTLAATTPGGDENGSPDQGKAIDFCKRLNAATGATIVVITHSGKDQSKGIRGWSGVPAAADAILEVTRDGENDVRTVRVAKLKDDVDGSRFGFRLLRVPLGVDADGDEFSSAVVEHCEAPVKAPKAKPRGTNERAVMDAFRDLLPPDEGASVPVGDLITEAVKRLVHDPESGRDRRREYAARALNGLGHLRVENDRVFEQ